MGYFFPLGTPTERASGVIPAPFWVDATGYRQRYRIDTPDEAFHTGNDWNLNKPFFDADKLAPVYAIAYGFVLFSGFLEGWGWVIVIWHVSPDGGMVLARYAHVTNPKVQAGAWVTPQTQIAQVGNAE